MHTAKPKNKTQNINPFLPGTYVLIVGETDNKNNKAVKYRTR